ncbi:MAG: hypothetical protein MZW92_63880 [Comamonadaceae bacterium]|nr:hypothetical protein [Comamonadaceae bacterium]
MDDIAPAGAPAATAPASAGGRNPCSEAEEQRHDRRAAGGSRAADGGQRQNTDAAGRSGASLRLSDDIDVQLLPIFLEEATDLIRETGAELQNWRAAPAGQQRSARLGPPAPYPEGQRSHGRRDGTGRTGPQPGEPRRVRVRQTGCAHPSSSTTRSHSLDRASALLDQLRAAPVDEAAAADACAEAALLQRPWLPGAACGNRRRRKLLPRAPPCGSAPTWWTEFVERGGRDRHCPVAHRRRDAHAYALRCWTSRRTSSACATSCARWRSRPSRRCSRGSPGPKRTQAEFDPLEMDRFTRLQELTRMMAETRERRLHACSTACCATLQTAADAALTAQARLDARAAARRCCACAWCRSTASPTASTASCARPPRRLASKARARHPSAARSSSTAACWRR